MTTPNELVTRANVQAKIPNGYAVNWRTYEAFKFGSCREANCFAADCDDAGKTEVGTYAFSRNLSSDHSVKMEHFIILHNKLADRLKFKKITIFESRDAAAEQILWMLNKLPTKK